MPRHAAGNVAADPADMDEHRQPDLLARYSHRLVTHTYQRHFETGRLTAAFNTVQRPVKDFGIRAGASDKVARAARLRVLAASRRPDGKDHGGGRPRLLAREEPPLLALRFLPTRPRSPAGHAGRLWPLCSHLSCGRFRKTRLCL